MKFVHSQCDLLSLRLAINCREEEKCYDKDEPLQLKKKLLELNKHEHTTITMILCRDYVFVTQCDKMRTILRHHTVTYFDFILKAVKMKTILRH